MMPGKAVIKKGALRIKFTALVIEAAMLCGLIVWLAKAHAQDLSITADFTGKSAVAINEAISFRLSRPLLSSEGRLAVMVGKTDMTAFFLATEESLTFTPKLVQLPEIARAAGRE